MDQVAWRCIFYPMFSLILSLIDFLPVFLILVEVRAKLPCSSLLASDAIINPSVGGQWATVTYVQK